MQEGRQAWFLKRFCPVLTACILCLGIGLFFGRMLLRQNTGAQTPQTGRAVIAEHTPVPASPDSVDLNTASVGELAELPGIGAGLAERIVEYRREHGKFRYAYELMDVPGISEKIYMELRERITAG